MYVIIATHKINPEKTVVYIADSFESKERTIQDFTTFGFKVDCYAKAPQSTQQTQGVCKMIPTPF